MIRRLIILLLIVGCGTEPEDCAGVEGGTAVLDDCSICTGIADYVAGSCYDCAGVANGTAQLDNCGICDTDLTNDCVQDCAGIWGGSTVVDVCGGCDGDYYSSELCDEDCYVPLGDSCAIERNWNSCKSIESTTQLRLLNVPTDHWNICQASVFSSNHCYLTNLSEITYWHSHFYGIIPDCIENLPSLKRLDLSMNSFTGEIPSTIGNLKNLELLNLNDNQLSGEIPSEIGNLTSLTHLWLSNNQLSGEIPQAVCDLIERNNLAMDYYILEGNNLTNTCE